MAILEGLLTSGIFEIIKKSFTANFGKATDALDNKVYDAANKAVNTFIKEYRDQFGNISDSFFARQKNWDLFFQQLRFDTPTITEMDIDTTGFGNCPPVTVDAVRFFLSELKKEMRKERDIANLLDQKKHIEKSDETHRDVKDIKDNVGILKEKLDTVTAVRQPDGVPKVLTSKLPRLSNSKIIGREEELTSLHLRLFDSKQVLLVNGMGGIGKTTLAQVYVDTYWDEYAHIAWIVHLSDDIKESFINTEGLLDTLSVKNDAGMQSGELFSATISSFNKITDAPNLLVIDNAQASLSEIYEYLPKQPNWHILVTSREIIDKFDVQEIGFLSEDKAIELFLLHYKRNDIPHEKIASLVNLVELHTLTIEILAKSAQRQHFTIGQLEHAIESDLRANVTVAHQGKKIDRITSYLCSIFKMENLSANEMWLLKQFACMPPEYIAFDTAKSYIVPEDSSKQEVFPETIALLCDKGWLLGNSETDSYKLHRILSEVVRKQLTISVEDIAPLLDSITRLLSIDQTKDNPVDKFPFIPYGKSIEAAFTDSDHIKIGELQNNLATVLQDLGDYAGAKELLEKAMTSAEKNIGPEHPETAVRYSNLALVLQDLGDYAGAKELLEKAMRSAEKKFGPEHPTTAVSYSNLATVLRALGDYAGAKELLEKAMRSAEKNIGPEHPATAVRYSNLALVLKDLGDYAGAKELLEKAMTSDEKNFGPEHPATAVRYSNLALVLQDLGDYAGAKELLEKAMTSAEKNFGPEHPATAVSYSNLATVLQALGDYAGAKEFLEKAMTSAEKNFGPEHPTTAVSYSNLALVLKDLGDYAGAKELLEKAMTSDEKKFGPEHPSTAVDYSNLATVLKALGDYAGALKLSEKSVEIFLNVLPEEHPNIRTVVSIRNSIKEDIAKSSEAEK